MPPLHFSSTYVLMGKTKKTTELKDRILTAFQAKNLAATGAKEGGMCGNSIWVVKTPITSDQTALKAQELTTLEEQFSLLLPTTNGGYEQGLIQNAIERTAQEKRLCLQNQPTQDELTFCLA